MCVCVGTKMEEINFIKLYTCNICTYIWICLYKGSGMTTTMELWKMPHCCGSLILSHLQETKVKVEERRPMVNTRNLAVSRINLLAVINFQLLAIICTSMDFDSERRYGLLTDSATVNHQIYYVKPASIATIIWTGFASCQLLGMSIN